VTERAIHIGLLLSALALAGWVFGSAGPGLQSATRSASRAPRDQASLLALIPPGSAFLLTADLRQLEGGPLGAFLSERVARLGGAGKLAKLCGFEPLARLDQLVISVPSADLAAQEHPEDFGIVAAGRFRAAEITECAAAVIRERGGESVPSTVGDFRSVRSRGASGGEVAARDGLLIMSGGSYFRALVDAAGGSFERREHQDPRDARHAELRASLGAGALVASWLLGDNWLLRVAGDEASAKLSVLSAVTGIAARLDLGRTTSLSVLLACASNDGAARLASWLVQLRSSLGGLIPSPELARLAERVTIRQAGPRLELGLMLSQAELQVLAAQLLGP